MKTTEKLDFIYSILSYILKISLIIMLKSLYLIIEKEFDYAELYTNLHKTTSIEINKSIHKLINYTNYIKKD